MVTEGGLYLLNDSCMPTTKLVAGKRGPCSSGTYSPLDKMGIKKKKKREIHTNLQVLADSAVCWDGKLQLQVL